ncbi:unnamed protein product [Adineta steineri]|uniref:NACHT domain-containing protein n=1 Tax=Adineta steineri TaxID=433720 RepID=A0A818NZH5_9BILA|nr:unnamed protein product [Adineta steineri]CAF3615285.1 unnamed protein product [Adineta steineri]
MAEGVENASVVCCFMSPEYQESDNCKLELKYAQTRRKRILPCIVTKQKGWKPSDWLGLITAGLLYVNFKDDSEETIRLKAKELINRIKEQSSSLESTSELTYLTEIIKCEYMRTQNTHIGFIMDPNKSYPIKQNYINLNIVKSKDLHDKKKKIYEAQLNNAAVTNFEDIDDIKAAIDIKDIFEICNSQEKQVLITGRAGVGKSAFCRYVAHQWAMGSHWSQYKLLVFIPLRHLTANRYPPDKNYSLLDLVKKELFNDNLSEYDTKLLKKQFNAKTTLWVLDGYDEIVQNVPPHLGSLFKQLLITPHHILTSRSCMNTLLYNVQMEVMGFTDQNIEEYVQQFFHQINNASNKSKTLLNFLNINQSISSIAHIPINLELICSLWTHEDWTETKELTITKLYTMMTKSLCERYLKGLTDRTLQISTNDVEEHCRKELTFLENLAFNAMKSNSIILRPSLLRAALNEMKLSVQEYPYILNIGVLQNFDKQENNNQFETNKDHYFVHLSFQEYFAARYLVNTLNGSSRQKTIEFIKSNKYNQRYTLLFAFVSGLLAQSNSHPFLNTFWNIILGESLDIVGIRHIQLIISCIEQSRHHLHLSLHAQLSDFITRWIEFAVLTQYNTIYEQLVNSLDLYPSLGRLQPVIDVFIKLLRNKDSTIKIKVCRLISKLSFVNVSQTLLRSLVRAFQDKNSDVRRFACKALCNIGKQTATNNVISELLIALEDKNENVRRYACITFEKIGEKVAISEVINRLMTTLEDDDAYVRMSACQALGKMSTKVEMNGVISHLVNTLKDENENVRMSACITLRKIGERTSMNDLISKLMNALKHENEYVRQYTCQVLSGINEKAITKEVISNLLTVLYDRIDDVGKSACDALGKISDSTVSTEIINHLVVVLEDEDEYVRKSACDALGKIGERAATSGIINRLLMVLDDENEDVRISACIGLAKIGKKAAINEVISRLLTALEHENEYVRQYARVVLGKMGELAATNEVINKLVIALEDEDEYVRMSACQTLGKMGRKAANNEVINKLVVMLEDKNENVKRSACIALREIGETTATNEMIKNLVIALNSKDENIRMSACIALDEIGKKEATIDINSKLMATLIHENEYVTQYAHLALGEMGEKAVTNEVVSKLMIALEHKNKCIRQYACQALAGIGERAATNEMISKLVSALDDDNHYVRKSACHALGKMGESVATTEIISKLVIVLDDKNEDVTMSACIALEEIGGKAATNEVINRLLTVLEHENEYIRRYACRALGKLSDKAATNEITKKLVTILEDEDEYVRISACQALGKMSEKVTTNDIIKMLLNALGDEKENVRMNACQVLKNIGEKAAMNEVISKLVIVLQDEITYVRISACQALGEMGVKAAMNEVISTLAIALEDENNYVRHYAYEALGKMGERAATNEVIERLLRCFNYEDHVDIRAMHSILEKFLSFFSMLIQLDSNTVATLHTYTDQGLFNDLKCFSSLQLIETFLNTKNSVWLSFATLVTVLQGNAVIIVEDVIVVYEHEEPVYLRIPDRKLHDQLSKAFVGQVKRIQLPFMQVAETQVQVYPSEKRKISSSDLSNDEISLKQSSSLCNLL